MDQPETPNTPATIHPRKFAFLAPAQAQDELGRLGRFRILKVLGKGGMGMVFKAEDPVLERVVAVKVMLPEFAKKATAKERFLREARAAASIDHEHVIAILHVDEDRGVPFIAMTFLKGMSLDDWLKRKGPVTVPQILRIGREIARGLAAAHQQGVIHRDIKPANLWLDSTTKGRIKILDFGLARPEAESTGLTQSGQLVGTPAYMSPEQAAGAKLDARTDVFSLGVVLYRLCTGVLPFTGKNVMAVLTSLASTEPEPAAQANPDVPKALSDLIARMLRKKPSERPASAQEVADALGAIERDRQLGQLGLTEAKASRPGISMIETSRTQADRTHAEDVHRTRPSQHVHFEDSGDSFLEETEFDREADAVRAGPVAKEPLLPFVVGGCIVKRGSSSRF